MDVTWIDADVLENISPHPAFKGSLYFQEEVSLEQLKTKLPNLTDVHFFPGRRGSSFSNRYLTKFCRDFPLLDNLRIAGHGIQGSDNLCTAISLLQNLRILDLWPCSFTEDQVYTMLKNLTNLEDFALYHTRCVLLPLAQMPRLRTLTISLEPAYRNIHLFTNQNNFPELKELTIYSRITEPITEHERSDINSWRDEVRTQLKNYRPTLDTILHCQYY